MESRFLPLSVFGWFWVRRFHREGESVRLKLIRPTAYSHGVITPWYPDKYEIISENCQGAVTGSSWQSSYGFGPDKTSEGLYIRRLNKAATFWTLRFFENLYKAGFLISFILLLVIVLGKISG